MADHPRIRGEHRLFLWGPGTVPGSSPHTRGALRHSQGPDRRLRIIPAYAGSTRWRHRCCHGAGDHPRIRGEHAAHGPENRGRRGSSPHTRGARFELVAYFYALGIIPAYAGSTPRFLWKATSYADHPRIRGEHCWVGHSVGGCDGSSPHTRGAPAVEAGWDSAERIIPAYAGSTPRPGAGQSPAADHPRIRGEHAKSMSFREVGTGSSPHTRGARRGARRRGCRTRIIPAYAGSTATTRGPTPSRADHPRIRGEHRRRYPPPF